MARGRVAKVGERRVAPNGYSYTKCQGGAWRLTHHLIAEKNLGRSLRAGERVSFKDGDKTNFKPDNIVVGASVQGSLQRKAARLEARIEEMQAQLDEINSQILIK